MNNEDIDFVEIFDGLTPEQCKELADRIKKAILDVYQDFKASLPATRKDV
jgi:hypothetical protein